MSNIIELPTASRTARPLSDQQLPASVTAFVPRALTPRQERRRGKPELPPPATETAKNSRIRNARRDAWWHAGRLTEYWRARLDWEQALEVAQRYGIADSASFPSVENDRIRLVAKMARGRRGTVAHPRTRSCSDHMETCEGCRERFQPSAHQSGTR
jgi:hypothetical protein